MEESQIEKEQKEEISELEKRFKKDKPRYIRLVGVIVMSFIYLISSIVIGSLWWSVIVGLIFAITMYASLEKSLRIYKNNFDYLEKEVKRLKKENEELLAIGIDLVLT